MLKLYDLEYFPELYLIALQLEESQSAVVSYNRECKIKALRARRKREFTLIDEEVAAEIEAETKQKNNLKYTCM